MKRVLVLSGHVGPQSEYIIRARRNHEKYCCEHNYSYHFEENFVFIDDFVDESPLITYTWLKAVKALEFMEKGKWDYIFGIDSDSTFWNFRKNLDDLISKNKDFVFTGDSWDLFNGGHFLVRSSPWSIHFFQQWLSMRSIVEPSLNTSHIGLTGRLMDQPAMNILLHAGSPKVFNTGEVFNNINGYKGNRQRKHKFFHLTHAPTSSFRLWNARRLIHENFKSNVEVVLQDRLNAYPFDLPGKRFNIENSDIIHFPGDSKDLLSRFA